MNFNWIKKDDADSYGWLKKEVYEDIYGNERRYEHCIVLVERLVQRRGRLVRGYTAAPGPGEA